MMADQPMPTPAMNEERGAHDLVLGDSRLSAAATLWIQARKQIGLDTYDTVLTPNNGRDGGRDAVEEAADLVTYLRNLISEGRAVVTEYGIALDLLNRLVSIVGPPLANEGELSASVKSNCRGLHCKCMNLDGKCPSPHYGDHDCHYERAAPDSGITR
jgi:hypothetical protein